MAGKRHKPEEIAVKLQKVKLLNSQSMSIADAIWKISGKPERAIGLSAR